MRYRRLAACAGDTHTRHAGDLREEVRTHANRNTVLLRFGDIDRVEWHAGGLEDEISIIEIFEPMFAEHEGDVRK